jgi:hypothetical protein
MEAPEESRSQKRPRIPHKWQRILAAFVAGRSLHRFEAEKLADHCLHSTVSTLEKKGVTILRRSEKVRGYMGIPTDVQRYWLAPESVGKARELLGEVAS